MDLNWGKVKATRDIREAGKCLAFDLGTAAGFHIARAVESVVLQYLNILCPQALENLSDGDKNLGKYVGLARKHGADEKVCASLDQFRLLHRNPLMHPDESIDVEEAMILLAIASSAIFGIMLDIMNRENT